MNNYQVEMIPLSEIYSDNVFNCRGAINPIDVKELAEDIKSNTLQFPISVQPASEVEGGIPDGFKYRIVAGHRRFMAHRVIKAETIPAMIKHGLSEVQARVFNLSENLNRKELNIVQEATAVKSLKDLGMVQEAVARAIGRTRSWVQIRFNLLELPEVIQLEAAAGVLNQTQIKQLYSLPDDEARYAAVRKIKTALVNGDKGIAVGKPPQSDPYKKKRRAKNEIEDMIKHLGEGVGFGLHTRCLAWANGMIDTATLYLSVKEEFPTYRIPVAELDKVASSAQA